ncbi:MAG: LamG-like jellyroll fold domain-containing protein, partial [Planctomycetota bacterium]
MERYTERGMALIAVVAVLIALVLIATPFALQMQSAATRTRALLYTARANEEAESLFAEASLYLLRGTEENERLNAARNEASLASPDYDVSEEFQIPRGVLERHNQNSSRGRIWDIRVEDEQAKVNVNTAPYTLLANILGITTLARDAEPDDTKLQLSDASAFPEEGGYVRIGFELVKYESKTGNTLEGVSRGVDADQPWNNGASAWEKGERVMHGAAFEIASYPIRVSMGHYEPFRNRYQIRRIHEIGSVSLDPDTFDRSVGDLTCYSGRVVAGGWCNSQTLRSAIRNEAEGGGAAFRVDNPWYFGEGTIVRVTDGTNIDYGIVVENKGGTIWLGNQFDHEYEIDRARVESMARHPVNLNTAPDDVLVACMKNVALRLRESQDYVTEEEALALVERIREQPVKSLYQLKEILRAAVSDEVISQHDYNALYYNALNPHDFRLSFSTVPFSFKSGDVYTITATAILNSKAGEEIARKTLRRVVSVNPRSSSVWSVESQNDFDRHIIAARTGKYMMSFPYNTGTGLPWEWRNVPASRVASHLYRDIWPSFSREPGIGDVRLQPERLDIDGVFHYDESSYSDGHYIREGALSYSTKQKDVDMVDSDGMMKPLAVSFWWKPLEGSLAGNSYFFDSGEETYQNRVALFYDGTNQEIVLRVADGTLRERASEVRYKVDGGRFDQDNWYHLAANVTGSKPGDLSLIIDGNSVGDPAYMTRLTQSVPATGEVSQLSVEDAETFPDSGALIVRGEDGTEIFEYDGKSSGSFNITKRFARIPLRIVNGDDFNGISHYDGDVVELHGYSAPLMTDLRRGGATLTSD